MAETPAANAFLARPMQILLRHAGKPPPAPGQPGIFALGAPSVLQGLLVGSGYRDIEQRTMSVPLRLSSAQQALTMMQEAFGAYRGVINDSPEPIRAAAWAEVAEMLKSFERPGEFVASAEVLIAAGMKSS